jgi:hypothetical protein
MRKTFLPTGRLIVGRDALAVAQGRLSGFIFRAVKLFRVVNLDGRIQNQGSA